MKYFKLIFTIAISSLIMETQAQECVNCNNPFPPIGKIRFASKIGMDNTVEGSYSFSGGLNSITRGTTSFSFGEEALAEKNHSFALGYHAKALGIYSVALGIDDTASGVAAVAIGFNNNASGDGAMTFGTMLQGTGVRSFVIGTGGGGYPAKKLKNAYPESLMIGFNSTKPTLFVSTSPSNPQYNLTGKVGIGNVTNPLHKLHIKADAGEVASVLIEPDRWNTGAQASLFLGNNFYGIKANERTGLTFNTQKNYYFPDGKVSIGNITEPQHKLHIKADAGEEASLFIEPAVWNSKAEASIYLGTDGYGLTAENNGLSFHTQSNYMFNDGYIGVGTPIPQYDLHVDGTIFSKELKIYNAQQPPQAGWVLTALNSYGDVYWAAGSSGSDLWHENGDDIYFNEGNVGIGNETPSYPLDVAGNVKVSGDIIGGRDNWQSLKLFAGTDANDGAYMSLNSNYNHTASIKLFARGANGRVEFHNHSRQIMSIRGDDNVYIGNPNDQSDLFVYGEINAHLVRVKNDIPWWDCVFKQGYKLMPLDKLEEFVNENHHLPDMPAEEEVQKNGIELAEMNALLLKKVEELTLYVIELKKENEGIRVEIEIIKKK